jgi:hypothetical protein
MHFGTVINIKKRKNVLYKQKNKGSLSFVSVEMINELVVKQHPLAGSLQNLLDRPSAAVYRYRANYKGAIKFKCWVL